MLKVAKEERIAVVAEVVENLHSGEGLNYSVLPEFLLHEGWRLDLLQSILQVLLLKLRHPLLPTHKKRRRTGGIAHSRDDESEEGNAPTGLLTAELLQKQRPAAHRSRRTR